SSYLQRAPHSTLFPYTTLFRSSDKRGRLFASLLMGAYENGKLVYQGRVGTGFDEEMMEDLGKRFSQLKRETSPFDKVPREFARQDRKSTRLNSSHVKISYAVFC